MSVLAFTMLILNDTAVIQTQNIKSTVEINV